MDVSSALLLSPPFSKTSHVVPAVTTTIAYIIAREKKLEIS